MTSPYAVDGVNLSAGDLFSAFAGAEARKTWEAAPYASVLDLSGGHFRGPRSIRTTGVLPVGSTLTLVSDGIGTKVVLHDAAAAYEAAGYDLWAMVGSDILRWGGLPLACSNVLDVSSLGETTDPRFANYQKLIRGLASALIESKAVLLSGETAELGQCVGSENPEPVAAFNWSASALGAYHPKLLITGKEMRAGDAVIALRERGFRSNGISSVRKALARKYGSRWHQDADPEVLRAAAAPSVLYDRFLAHANGWHSFDEQLPLTSLVHISGGGIPSKFARDILFPLGLSAQLDDLWDPPEVMRQCFEWRSLSDTEAYETWNGGQGFLATLREKDADLFVALAKHFDIEAKRCGTVYVATGKAPALHIVSKYSGERVCYEA